MNNISTYIKQRLSLREPLAEALEVLTKLVDKLSLSKPDKQENKEAEEAEYKEYLENQLQSIKEVCPSCRDFERDFPSFAFSIATGIGKTRLMGACIAYLYLTKGIKHFFILAPNLTLYEKLMRDFGVRPLTFCTSNNTYFSLGYGKPKTTFKGNPREGKAVEPHYRIKENAALSKGFNTIRIAYYLAMNDILEAKKDSLMKKERQE